MDNARNIYVNTGNILSIPDITKKPGQNPTEELMEAIRCSVVDYQLDEGIQGEPGQPLIISRKNDDVNTKISEHDINDLKIVLKIFLNSDGEEVLISALEKGFKNLNQQSVDSVIISYNNKNGDNPVEKLQKLWKILEKYSSDGKIGQIGLSDVEEPVFTSLYNLVNVKPSIIQINLATCCVVPPTLQAFCKDNEIQLLTHSDPSEILPDNLTTTIFSSHFMVDWVVRFLIHVKCRGVLASKGYLVSLSK